MKTVAISARQCSSWRSFFGCLELGSAATAALTLITILLAAALAAPSSQAQTYKLLHNFTGGLQDGSGPYAGLVRDGAGNLYGTTVWGGAHGWGTVFKLDSSGAERVLYSFANNPDGAKPYAGLLLDPAGNLFGTTEDGGSSYNGTVFKIDPTGAETVLHSFNGYPVDGSEPYAGLVRDPAGNLYGTTIWGGTSTAYYGTVFKVDPTGTETMLHSFSRQGPDGYQPWGGLVLDTAGNLYGGTVSTIFKLDVNAQFTVLFQGGSSADLVRDPAGNLYGTAYGGGDYGNGVVFKVDTNGIRTFLYSFRGGNDGAGPEAGLVRDSAGNLYGTTFGGGGSHACDSWSSGCGTVFKLDPTGRETVLHAFTGPDGATPHSSLVLDSAGILYGTALFGGTACSFPPGCGVAFKLRSISDW